MREEAKRHARGDPRRGPVASRGRDGERLVDEQRSGRARARRADGALARAGAPRGGVAERPERAGIARRGEEMLAERRRAFDDPSGQGEQARGRRPAQARGRIEMDGPRSSAQLRKRAAERAREQLEQRGRRGGAARGPRARARPEGTRQGVAPAAGDRVDRGRRARRAAGRRCAKQGDADKGLERQREAQRDLEAAREQLEGEDDGNGPPSSGGDEGKTAEPPATSTSPSDHKGPEEFRRRVVRGLGQPASGSLRDAVQRYAEGLLR